MQINTSYSGSSTLSSVLSTQDLEAMDAKVASDIFKAKDNDGSGSLSATELGTSAESLSEFDTNGDGQISSEELQAGLKARREKMQASMQNQMAQNGQMGMLQASMGQGVDMSAMDTKMSKGIMNEKDANKDGVLSAEELGVSADNLSAVDTDGDGNVSESELTASLKAHREEMMAENGGSMPPPPPDAVSGTGSTTSSTSSTSSASGVQSGMSATELNKLVASLFASTSSDDSSTSSSTSLSETSALNLSEYLQRQKASNSYLNMDRLINDLFSTSGDTQSLSLSA
jgi:Ca2+-binding EF-hand superfamily protein